MPAHAATIDVRRIEPRHRHSLIFASFQDLAEGETLELVNDHDPAPLQRQFELLAPAEHAWSYIERGPQTWRVAITRVRPAEAAGSCCGACGGGGH